jgi:hypothetical protein
MDQPRSMFGRPTRQLTGRTRWLGRAALAGCVALVVAGCGGGDSAESAITVTPEDVAACLEDGGFEVTREAAMDDTQRIGDELKEMLGIAEVMLFDRSDGFGLGTVQFFEDDDAASEGQDGVAAVRTDEVEIGRVGDAVYDYIGDEPESAVAAIEGCLGA